MKMWWRQWMKDNENVVAAMDEKHWKCDGDSGVGKAMEMCW